MPECTDTFLLPDIINSVVAVGRLDEVQCSLQLSKFHLLSAYLPLQLRTPLLNNFFHYDKKHYVKQCQLPNIINFYVYMDDYVFNSIFSSANLVKY